MSLGHIEYAGLDGTHVFKLIGEVRAPSCCSLDHLLDKLDQLPTVQGVVVDLTDAKFMDSTALGVIAKLGIRIRELYRIQPVLLSTNDDLTTLANSMGLGQVFTLLNCRNTEACCLQSLPEEQTTQDEMLHTVLDAHRALMTLNANNRAMFEPLVRQLEREERRQQQAAQQFFALQQHS
ncbi:MAG: STAS domain-containing protein [Pseudomonadota bacterium]|nr:STAS domain-containing protein [Pseudomonadota bacterium]